MLDTQALSATPMATKEAKAAKKDNNTDTNGDFQVIMKAIQSNEDQPLNLDALLKQVLNSEALNNPKFKELLEQIPEQVLKEFKKLIGTPIKQILSDSQVSAEAKTLSLVAASYQMAGQDNPSLTKRLPEGKTAQVKQTLATQNKQGEAAPFKERQALQAKPNEAVQGKEGTKTTPLNEPIKTSMKEATGNKSKEIMRAIEQSANLSKIAEAAIPTNKNKQHTKTFANEVFSYGEYKVNRTNIPLIQVNTAESPEQTQQNFMKQLETLLKSSRFSQVAKNHSQMTIQLRPDNLGFMTIKVEQVNQEMVARIITSSTATKDMIESNLHQLRHLNIQVDKFDIQMQQSNNHLLRDEGQQQEKEEQQEGNQNDDNEQPDKSFEEELENILP